MGICDFDINTIDERNQIGTQEVFQVTTRDATGDNTHNPRIHSLKQHSEVERPRDYEYSAGADWTRSRSIGIERYIGGRSAGVLKAGACVLNCEDSGYLA